MPAGVGGGCAATMPVPSNGDAVGGAAVNCGCGARELAGSLLGTPPVLSRLLFGGDLSDMWSATKSYDDSQTPSGDNSPPSNKQREVTHGIVGKGGLGANTQFIWKRNRIS